MAVKSILAVWGLLLIQGSMSAQNVDWYPLKEGNRWQYRSIPADAAPGAKSDDPARKVVITVDRQVSFKFKRDGKEVEVAAYRLVGVSEDRKLTEHVAVLGDGIYRYATSGDKDITAPLQILKLPVVIGDKWACNVPVEGGPLVGTFTVRAEAVKVPAGEFKNAVVVSGPDFQVGKQKMSMEFWFVPGIGLVKQRVKRGTLTVVLELEEYAVGR